MDGVDFFGLEINRLSDGSLDIDGDGLPGFNLAAFMKRGVPVWVALGALYVFRK